MVKLGGTALQKRPSLVLTKGVFVFEELWQI